MLNILIVGADRGIANAACRQLSARGEHVIAACLGNGEGFSEGGVDTVRDTGCDITRRESEPTSAWSSMARESEEPRSGGRQMTGSTHGAQANGADAGAPPANDATWEQINWGQVVEEVTRLQARIAKATQAGRWNKVQALQRLLTHSRSGKLLAVRRVTENKGERTA